MECEYETHRQSFYDFHILLERTSMVMDINENPLLLEKYCNILRDIEEKAFNFHYLLLQE